jgi:YVTN family beta-propeller protein
MMLSVRAKQRVLWMLALIAWSLADPGEPVLANEGGKGSGPSARQAVKQGVAVEFRIEPLAGKKTDPALEGADAVVRFQLKDAATQAPIKGLRPAAWLDPRTKPTQAKEPPLDCQDKVRAFLQGGLGFRPAVDLNSYYLLALNDGPSISVIDPLLGFGSSKLLTQVPLPSPGEDWVSSSDQNRLYVTLPEANEVAVVDTTNWKVIRTIPLAGKPTRLALQPDGKYLWVGRNGPSTDDKATGTSVIDTDALKVAAEFPTGPGRHEFAFTADNRYAFVSNGQPGTVSVFDVRNLSKVKDLATGAAPVSLAFSPLSRTLYVGHADGRVVVIDGQTHEASARLATDPGLTVVRFSPDGRWAFAASGEKSRVHAFDASTNRLAHTFDVGSGPDQITFTDHYAYIRARVPRKSP